MSANGGKGRSIQGEYASIARELGRGAMVTVIRGANLGARMLVRVDGSTEGSLGSDELDRVGASQADELMWAERSEAIAGATRSQRTSGAKVTADIARPTTSRPPAPNSSSTTF